MYDGGWVLECEELQVGLSRSVGFPVKLGEWDGDIAGVGLGWESQPVVVQGAFSFSATRSGVYQVEAECFPEVVGRDGVGDPAVEEVEAATSRSGCDLVHEVCAVFDSLGVVLNCCLVDCARVRSLSGELWSGGVVEKEVAAEFVLIPGWEDLFSGVVLFQGCFVQVSDLFGELSLELLAVG